MGDAGVGKSRLLFDFDAWLAERPETVWWFRGRASPSTRTSASALLRDVMAARLGIQIDDPRDEVRERFVQGFVDALGPEGARDGILVGAWLGFDTDDGSVDLPTDPQALRDQGTLALGRYFQQLAEKAAVVVLLEDLHWADDETLRWLDAVHPLLEQSRVFVVGTTRPTLLESRPRWGEGLAQHVRLELPALSRRESRELLGQILHRVASLPESLVAMVIDTAEGNPFYIEELVTWLVDAGVIVKAEPDWFVVDELVHSVAVPSTLKGVLQSRLDALSARERGLLQRASVVGRVFWDAAVERLDEALAPAEEPSGTPLGGTLDTLRQRQIVLQREVSRFASAREFLFKHALLRDVAYDGILRAQRERYHLGTARWLVETSTSVDRGDEYAAVIAEHFERARDPEAATWYLRAGRRAASVFALAEARDLLDKAHRLAPADDAALRFDVLAALESLLERIGDREGQSVQIEEMRTLADALDAPRGVQLLLISANRVFVHSEYVEACRLAGEAAEAAEAIGRDDLRADALLLKGKALTWADETDDAHATISQAVEVGREAGREGIVGEGLRYLGMLAGNLGDYPASLELTTQAREVFARAGDTEMESAALAQQATTLFNMARFAEAQTALEATLPIFQRAGHRYREAVALGNLASIAVMQGRFATSERYALHAIEISRELDELESIAIASLVLAHGELFTGRFAEARSHTQESLAIAHDIGNAALEADALTRLVHVSLITDELDAAVEYGRLGLAAGEKASSDLDRGYTHLSVGYALRWTGRVRRGGHPLRAGP